MSRAGRIVAVAVTPGERELLVRALRAFRCDRPMKLDDPATRGARLAPARRAAAHGRRGGAGAQLGRPRPPVEESV
jgi:hypothetical protein